MPTVGRGVERRLPMLVLKIKVTSRFNQLLSDGSMPFQGCYEDRRASIVQLSIEVTASFNQLLRDSRMPLLSRDE